MAVQLYVAQLTDFGIETIGSREIAATSPDRRAEVASAIATARIVWSAAVALLTATLALVALPTQEGSVIALMMTVVVAKGMSTRWVHLGIENALPVGGTRVVGEVLTLTLIVLSVRDVGDINRVPLAQAAGETTAVVLLVMALRRVGLRLYPTWRRSVFNPIFKRALPMMSNGLLSLTIYSSDLVFIRILLDERNVGLYAAAYTLLSFVFSIGIMYAHSLLPTLTRLGATTLEEGALFRTAQAQAFTFALPAGLGAFLVRGPLIGLLFGADYQPSVDVAAILAWTVPVVAARAVSMAGLIARGRQDLLLRTTVFGAALNLALNALLIPEHGIVGAAIATLVTETLRLWLALGCTRAIALHSCPLARLWRPTVATLAMTAAVLSLPTPSLFVGVAVGAATYLVALALVGGIRFGPRGHPRLAV